MGFRDLSTWIPGDHQHDRHHHHNCQYDRRDHGNVAGVPSRASGLSQSDGEAPIVRGGGPHEVCAVLDVQGLEFRL